MLPFIFDGLALLGGLRVVGDVRAFVFFPRPDYARSRRAPDAAVCARWPGLKSALDCGRQSASNKRGPHLGAAHIFLASAQAFNSVLPEAGYYTGCSHSFFSGRSGTISFQLSMRGVCSAAWWCFLELRLF